MFDEIPTWKPNSTYVFDKMFEWIQVELCYGKLHNY